MTLAGFASIYGLPMAIRAAQERNLRRFTSESRSLVLSYDDGPGPHLTASLLPILASRSVKATFFLLGRRAMKSPEMVNRLRDEGHELGCHTLEHKHAWKAAPWRTLLDMNAGYESLQNWIGKQAIFRPPYGKLCLPTLLELRRRKIPIAWWTIDSGDTHHKMPTPQSVADAVARAAGGIVLMHDFDRQKQQASRAEFVLRTTELLIQTAQREGLRMCRCGDLWDNLLPPSIH